MINFLYLLFASCMVSQDVVMDDVEEFRVVGETYMMSVDYLYQRRSVG